MPEEVLETAVDELEPQGGEGEPQGGEGEGQKRPEDLRKAMAELAAHVKTVTAPKEPARDEPQLTEEQKAEMWAIFDPEKSRKDFFQKFFRLNPEATPEEVKEAKELFADMQKGLVRQAIVGSKNLTTIELEKLREELKPLHEYVSTARAKETRSRFFESYESLNKPEYSKILDASARLLADKEFNSEDEYFKALAESAAETIKAVRPEFDLGKKTETTKPKTGSAPRLPRTSVGGQGGAGKGGHEPAKSQNDIDTLD